MHVFSVVEQAEFDPKKHVEKILGQVEAGDADLPHRDLPRGSRASLRPSGDERSLCRERNDQAAS